MVKRAMVLADYTAQIKTAVGGAAGQNYDGAVLLNEVEKLKAFKERFSSMSLYIENEAMLDHSRAYRMMAVARNFTRQNAVDYGIDPLDYLLRIQQVAFVGNKPAELLAGQHSFTEPDGTTTHTLDFANDHRIVTLKALLTLAEHAHSAGSTKPPSETAAQIDAAVQAVTKLDATVVGGVHPAPKKSTLTITLTAPDDKMINALTEVTSQFSITKARVKAKPRRTK